MVDGPADRSHRLRALGNAVVPQIPEIIGRAIMNGVTVEQKGKRITKFDPKAGKIMMIPQLVGG
jgi:hypothetical protein